MQPETGRHGPEQDKCRRSASACTDDGTPCAYTGGNAIGETSPNLLDALHREQGRLGNLQPGEQFSLAGGGKSIKAIFAMAGDQNVCYYHSLMHIHRAVCVQGFSNASRYIRPCTADRPDAYMCPQRRTTMTISSKSLA